MAGLSVVQCQFSHALVTATGVIGATRNEYRQFGGNAIESIICRNLQQTASQFPPQTGGERAAAQRIRDIPVDFDLVARQPV